MREIILELARGDYLTWLSVDAHWRCTFESVNTIVQRFQPSRPDFEDTSKVILGQKSRALQSYCKPRSGPAYVENQ